MTLLLLPQTGLWSALGVGFAISFQCLCRNQFFRQIVPQVNVPHLVTKYTYLDKANCWVFQLLWNPLLIIFPLGNLIKDNHLLSGNYILKEKTNILIISSDYILSISSSFYLNFKIHALRRTKLYPKPAANGYLLLDLCGRVFVVRE